MGELRETKVVSRRERVYVRSILKSRHDVVLATHNMDTLGGVPATSGSYIFPVGSCLVCMFVSVISSIIMHDVFGSKVFFYSFRT